MNYTRGCYHQPNMSATNRGKNHPDVRRMPTYPRMNGYCGTNDHDNDMNYKLGMVYSPYQEWQNLYPSDKGFTEGTIFMELNKPFEGYKYNKGGSCLL